MATCIIWSTEKPEGELLVGCREAGEHEAAPAIPPSPSVKEGMPTRLEIDWLKRVCNTGVGEQLEELIVCDII
jgi:hypothetical protein